MVPVVYKDFATGSAIHLQVIEYSVLLRARLQPCHKPPSSYAALAAEVGFRPALTRHNNLSMTF
jgi:hypothetical protein